MKVIIIDDSAKNLEAAKKVAEQFPEHEFVCMNNASDAIAALDSADAVITDLFFPGENHGEGTALGDAYGEYRAKLKKDEGAYLKVLQDYYDWDFERAEQKLECAISMATDGTSRVALEGLIQSCEKRGRECDAYRKRLENLPSAQFPYGGAVMLRAHELGKKSCLISDIHSHAGSYRDNVSSVDGMMLFLPLISEGIVSVQEAKYDGKECLKYVGEGELSRAIGGYPGGVLKERPEVWAEAIRRIAAQ
ncbi:MAG: response regulator [Candidatus Moranbacteria bacterium]|nr:response regulator [Candidatus Moranbacteria bacterium]